MNEYLVTQPISWMASNRTLATCAWDAIVTIPHIKTLIKYHPTITRRRRHSDLCDLLWAFLKWTNTLHMIHGYGSNPVYPAFNLKVAAICGHVSSKYGSLLHTCPRVLIALHLSPNSGTRNIELPPAPAKVLHAMNGSWRSSPATNGLGK